MKPLVLPELRPGDIEFPHPGAQRMRIDIQQFRCAVGALDAAARGHERPLDVFFHRFVKSIDPLI